MVSFKVATYNVNSIRSRMHIVLPWLRNNQPDVLCMQETKVEDEKFPVKEFEKIGYHVVFKGGKKYNGVAIASLEKPEKATFGLEDDGPLDGDRIIKGVYSGITVVNIYAPQGRDRENPQFRYKLDWFKRVRKYLDRHFSPQDSVLCCGDLNVAREDIDVHDPKRLLGHVDFTPEVWEVFDYLTSWGLVDIFRKHHPGESNQFAFFDYRVRGAVDRGLGWRVDHILATTPLAEKSSDSYIDLEPRRAEKPSDHTIMSAAFTL
jgi:exodeoxyribonuclease-3